MMRNTAWQRVAWPWLLVAGLAGCAASHRDQAAPKPVSAAQAPYFTVQTPIDQIAADESGKTVLEHDVPGVMNNPHYVLFSCMSLAQVASLSGGRLTQAKLDEVNRDLAHIPPCLQ